MHKTTMNVDLRKEEGVYYCISSPEEVNVAVQKSYETIKVSGKNASDLNLSFLLSLILKMYHCSGTRIFQIIFDDKCTLGERILNGVMYNLDRLAKKLECIFFIQYSCDYMPCFDNCDSTNVYFVRWDMSVSNDWNEFVKMISTFAGVYPYLSPHALKAAIINAVDAPLSHVVRNDGSFDFMKCLYSSENLINMYVGDAMAADGSEMYRLHFPLKSKRIRISATVNTVFSPNDPKKGGKYCDGIVTIDFPNLPGWNKKVTENKVCGNVHRVRIDLDVADLSGIDYELLVQFSYLLIDGGDIRNIDIMKFFGVISVENLEDDGLEGSFYHEMLQLNYVSNLNVARQNCYFP